MKMADVDAATHDNSVESAAKRRKMEITPGDVVAVATGCLEGGPVQAACLRMREKILAVERDYTHYFALDVGGEAGADQYVYQHFNTLCIVGIAPSSIAFANGRKVTQVDFDVGRSGDKTDAKKPSGKKKIGAIYLNETSRLCDLICDDGTRIKVRCALQGHLLEMNSRLLETPDLINTKASSEGFIAIIQPKREIEKDICKHCNLLGLDEYRAKRAAAIAPAATPAGAN